MRTALPILAALVAFERPVARLFRAASGAAGTGPRRNDTSAAADGRADGAARSGGSEHARSGVGRHARSADGHAAPAAHLHAAPRRRPGPWRGSGSRPVPFQARLLDGRQLSLSETAGTPTLLAFWAPW